MNKLQFTTDIHASREKVWNTLWDDTTYRQWTSAFSPTSYAVTDWKKGSKALFLGGNGDGMVSRIEESIPNEFMSIEHLGEVKNGVEDTTSDRVKQWAGAHENYTLQDISGGTRIVIDMDITDDFADMFKEMWPKALTKLKEIAEKE